MAREHTDETKARVVAALMAGQGVSEVSRATGVPKATVSRIKNDLAPEIMEQVGTEKKERLENLIADCLAANLTTLRHISEFARRPDWLIAQSAHDLAMFYGVTADKAVAILEAHAAAQPLEK
jgi:transposase-like protein